MTLFSTLLRLASVGAVAGVEPLDVSTGVPGQNGTVERFDAKTGLRLGTFVNVPKAQPGHLARATGMTWHEGDLLVASQGDGVVKRYDGKTGAWKADVARASPGGLRLDCTFTGSRQHERIDLRVAVLDGVTRERSVAFAPARLEEPNATLTDAGWAKIRRGLISLPRITPDVVPFEDGSGRLGSSGGILGNNAIHFLATGDTNFVRANKAVLSKVADYLVARDLDDDGLIETFRDGNGNNQFGDTGYDTISSGWKNALVNGQAYKSFLGVAKMMESVGDDALAKGYRQRAVRLRVAYNKTFYDAKKGRYIWWVGNDGKRHDYSNPLIQSNAVVYSIAECLEQDTGLKRGNKDVMQSLWAALEAAEYRDTKKGKTVKYMDAKSRDYTGLYWGIPGNLKSVPAAYNFQDYGKHEFPYYCNSCIFPSDTVTTITALMRAGMMDEATLLQRQIFKRQHEGIFPNGSGFSMGVVNGSEPAYSVLKWDGTPTNYEGIISRDCSFLQTAILADDPARVLFDAAAKLKP